MTTALYALPLVALYIVLAARVVNFRKANRVSLGDGGSAELLCRIRAHGNCGEYAPFGVVLLALAELSQAPAPVVHLSGVALVAGRFLHAWAIGWNGPMGARVAGMVLTFTAMGLASLTAAWLAL